MTRARAVLAAVVAVVLAAVLAVGVAVPASAAGSAPTSTIDLAWDGAAPGSADETFVGVPVSVPGDRAVRSLRVRNGGPSTGVLRAWVQEVSLLTAAADDGFYDDLRLDWRTASAAGDASFRRLAQAGRTPLGQTTLRAGESTVLSVGYTFPSDATTGNRSMVGAREASFVVHLDLRGELPGDDAGPGGGPGQGTGSDGSSRPEDSAEFRPGGSLASTGADVRTFGLLAALGVGAGGTLLAAARRRRRVRSAGAGRVAPSGG